MASTTHLLITAAVAFVTLALTTARPQFSFFGQPAPQFNQQLWPQVQAPLVPSPDNETSGGHGSVTVSASGPASAAATQEPPLSGSSTLGVCPANGTRLFNEPVVRYPIPAVRVATKIRYDGHGCFGQRDCVVSCVKILAPHLEWSPTTASITGGGLGSSGIEVTITSPVSRGYSVRILFFGHC